MSHRVLLLRATAAGLLLSACGEMLGDAAAVSANAFAVAAVSTMTGVELGRDSSTDDCFPKDATGCYDVVDPEWGEAMNVLQPPSGSVRPPPDCSICSPLSRPEPSASGMLSSDALPDYLMSDACIIDVVQARGILW